MTNIQQRNDFRRKSSVGTVEIQGPGGAVRTVPIEELGEADRALAAEFGYKPVFKREFGYLSTFSFAVSISGLFSTVATTFLYPLEAGGSASAVWCWLISGAGCMCIAIAGIASSEYSAATLLLAAVSIATDYDYVPTAGQTVGVMAGFTALTGVVNSLSTYWMEKMTKTYVIFHIAVLVSCSVALLVMAHPKHDATYVFTDIDNTSGWTPNGWSFLFGFLSVSWTMTDYDATAHITEEIREPELKAPWAISTAMLFTYVAGFLFNIVLCFCMGDPASILTSKINQPVAQLFVNVLGKAGGITFTLCAVIIIKFVCFTAMQSLGRTVFAFSRDRLLPFPQLWTKILPLTGTPILAVWISVFWCIAINLIALGSSAAINGVFNVTAIALDWSYCIPIMCKLIFPYFEPGPWHLGRFSTYVNAWACLWTLFVSIIFILPQVRPVTPSNMNYAIAYLIGILAFATAYWYLQGRKFYTGPLIEAESQDDSISSQAERSSDDETALKAQQDGFA